MEESVYRSLPEAVILSLSDMNDFIATIRERYHIEKVSPNDRGMIGVVRRQFTDNEWDEILQETEREISAEVVKRIAIVLDGLQREEGWPNGSRDGIVSTLCDANCRRTACV